MKDEYERAAKEVRKLFKQKGGKILKEAAASVLREKIESDEAREALSYFMSLWRDVVRPSLVTLACEAVGGDPSIVVPVGKSLTLLSGATDIHDDIIDRTMRKRGHDTVPGKFGNDIALLAGDALIFKGFGELFEGLMQLDIPTEKKSTIFRMVNRLYFEMGDAEALELKFKARTDIKPDDYLDIIRKKAADVEVCMRIGAMLGYGSKEQVNALGEYGRLLGTIVLLRNDVEDMFDVGILNLRIKNESLPLPILYALENEEKRGDILAILKRGEVSVRDAKRLTKLVSDAGGLDRLWKLFGELKAEANRKVMGLKNAKTKAILDATVPKTP